MMKRNYNIKTILESLKEDVDSGKISIREAAVELHKAGWTNFIDTDATRSLLKLRQPDKLRDEGNTLEFSKDMTERCRKLKAEHPDALYIFRGGDLCELYGDDATTASEILGIATTEYADGQGISVKTLCFPFRKLEMHLPKLVRTGNRVALCERIRPTLSDDPDNNRK